MAETEGSRREVHLRIGNVGDNEKPPLGNTWQSIMELIEILAMLLQLQYQTQIKDSAVFDCCVVIVFISYVAWGASIEEQSLGISPIWVLILKNTSYLLGSLAIILIVILLVLHLGLLGLVIWVLVFVIVVRKTVAEIRRSIREAVVGVISFLGRI